MQVFFQRCDGNEHTPSNAHDLQPSIFDCRVNCALGQAALFCRHFHGEANSHFWKSPLDFLRSVAQTFARKQYMNRFLVSGFADFGIEVESGVSNAELQGMNITGTWLAAPKVIRTGASRPIAVELLNSLR